MGVWARLCCGALFLFLSFPVSGQDRYKKYDIAKARYGAEEVRDLLEKAQTLSETINDRIAGQEHASQALENLVIQYLQSFGNRQGEPLQLHFMGLPGVGKSDMINVLQKAGFPIARIDLQQFANSKSQDLVMGVYSALSEFNSNSPRILVLEEVDKIPEVSTDSNGKSERKTQSAIGIINQMLSEGTLSFGGVTAANLSNTLILTTMNLHEGDIEKFAREILGEEKSFYEFTIEDLAKFNDWLLSRPEARYRLLSKLFRSNTVSRMAPSLVVFSSLQADDYRKIIENNIRDSVIRNTQGRHQVRRIEVTYSPELIGFFERHAIFPASGARETVLRTNLLMDQLIYFAGMSAQDGFEESLMRPRKIHFNLDPTTETVRATITPQKMFQNRELRDDRSFEIEIHYNRATRQWIQPSAFRSTPPSIVKETERRKKEKPEPPLTRKNIFEARYPKGSSGAKGLAKHLDESIYGQEIFTHEIEKEMGIYLGSNPENIRKPLYTILAGFPGIGKSEIVRLTSEYLELPVVKINLQSFAGAGDESISQFLLTLESEIRSAKRKSKTGRFIIAFEELDKVPEIDPGRGVPVDRPVMSVIKDLLNDGIFSRTVSTEEYSRKVTIDIRQAYSLVTMNFASDIFGFEGDPRLTSIDDLMGVWKKLSSGPAQLRKILGRMFLPETVTRMIHRLFILKPLQEKDYARIIDQQVEWVLNDRFFNQERNRNEGAVELRLTEAYRDYLLKECVIPSEGARFTANAARNRISRDLEEVLKKIPRKSDEARTPVEITLDFQPEKGSVVGSLGDKPIYEAEMALTFPPIELAPHESIPERRLMTAVHEFGHAFVATRLGERISMVLTVPPKPGIGGFVRFNPPSTSPTTAKFHLSMIYASLASRAMERIFLSDRPLSNQSVLDITSGASNDILQATSELWEVIFELGFSRLGIIERRGVEGMTRYASFADLPAEEVAALGQILREMENYMVRDLLASHSMEWYREKITRLARKGEMNEKEFFELIGLIHPGENNFRLGEESRLYGEFGKDIKELPESVIKAREYRDPQGFTAREILNRYSTTFEKLVEKHLGMTKNGTETPEHPVLRALGGASCRGAFGG